MSRMCIVHLTNICGGGGGESVVLYYKKITETIVGLVSQGEL